MVFYLGGLRVLADMIPELMPLQLSSPDSRAYSILGQRFITTSRPAASASSAALSLRTEAARGADVVYTDTWMSYHIPKEEQDRRVENLMPYQVNTAVMKEAADDAVFMNCLPARRGFEQTAEVIDGPQSVVFDQAENRMHAQNAVMLTLLGAV